ncbi:MAG: GTP pyrophosphokinase family protein [Candidatus Saccharibacteria bacterium]|nr:GTP pyrophosphokinase family protein [Candidatus Saccharibacteria bacterium]
MEKETLYELEDRYDEIAEECACGMRNVLTHVENLRSEMKRREERSPFEAVTSRIKTFDSTLEKCERKGWEISEETFREMHDIAGVRIIVPFLDDVTRVRDAITRRKNLIIDEERDYIKHPKKNGYRSYHMIVKVRVPFMYEDRCIPVEIQIRTKAQDFWSSMEHKLRYKNQNPAPEVASEFAEFSEELYQKEVRMMKMRDFNKIEGVVRDENEEAIIGAAATVKKKK